MSQSTRPVTHKKASQGGQPRSVNQNVCVISVTLFCVNHFLFSARSSEVPWYGLKKLRLKVASGGIISALCLPDEHLSGVKVRWQTPGGSSLEGNRLMKRAKDRRDFGTYSCQAVSITGGRWRRLVVVQNEASMRSASVVQNGNGFL